MDITSMCEHSADMSRECSVNIDQHNQSNDFAGDLNFDTNVHSSMHLIMETIELLKKLQLPRLGAVENCQDLEKIIRVTIETAHDCTNDDMHILHLLKLARNLLNMFVQFNWTGPPFSASTEEEVVMNELDLPHGKKQNVAIFEWLPQFSDRYAFDQLLLVSGTDSMYFLCYRPVLLLVAWVIFNALYETLKNSHLEVIVWFSRCIRIFQFLLDERSPVLKSHIMSLVEFIDQSDSNLKVDDRLCVYIELHYLLFFYYEPKMSTVYLKKAEKLSGLDIKMTGAMGKRTKWQQEEKAQLVLRVKRDGNNVVGGSFCTSLEHFPNNIALDHDTLMDSIRFSDAINPSEKLSDVEQALVLAVGFHKRLTFERHGTIEAEVEQAYLSFLLNEPTNWCIHFKALLLRTSSEDESPKRMERSLAQLEELVSQFEKCKASLSQRFRLFYTIQIPPKWLVEKQLADFLKDKMGCLKTALDIYLKLQLWEEVINVYKGLEQREKAEQVIRAELSKEETPSLWCHLGDVLTKEEFYLKSWSLSNCRFSRAMRNLGYLHLHQADFKNCIKCFDKCLKLNPLQLPVWFSYGCACLAEKQYQQAISAFHRCVAINSDNFEAWSNLATAYIRNGDKARAFPILQEALKCDYENWRLWQNFVVVATDVGAFLQSIHAYHRLLDLKQKYVDAEVLEVLVKAVCDDVEDWDGEHAGRLGDKLRELFGRIISTVTADSGTWKQYAILILSTSSITVEDYALAASCLQKSYRSLLNVSGWERDVDQCRKLCDDAHFVVEQLQLIAESQPTVAAQPISSMRLTIKSVIAKINKHQENAVTLKLPESLIASVELMNDLLKALNL